MTNAPDPRMQSQEIGRTIYIFPFCINTYASPLVVYEAFLLDNRGPLMEREERATDYVEIFLERRQTSLIKRRIIVSLPPARIIFPSDFRKNEM